MVKTKPFADTSSENYVASNLENGSLLSYRELPEGKITYVNYEDLPNVEVTGFPFCSDFIDKEGNVYSNEEFQSLSPKKKKECKLRYAFLPNYHEIYLGTTGSGKTTGCIEPQIRALSSRKNKPNLFITDPKGELFNHNARHLNAQGYRLFILNFKDFSKTDRWNPLGELYDMVDKVKKVGKGIEKVDGEISEGVIPQTPLNQFGETHYEYQGKAFPTKENLNSFLSIEKFALISQANSLATQLASGMISAKDSKDPVWEEGCRGLLYAIIMMLFYAALDESNGLTKDMFTLKTISETFSLIRNVSNGEVRNYAHSERFDKLCEGAPLEVLEKLHGVTKAPDGTRKSYFSVFESHLASWLSGYIYLLTSGTTIDIEDDSAPFAIFIATRDYDKSDFTIAASFIDWVYRRALLKAEKAPKNEKNEPLVRDTHFLLDEFGNVPRIPDFENKIATARSRKIWFHLYIQSYEQIDLVYGKECAQIIVDNCNQQAFLGSQSVNTKKRFSEECGVKSVRSFESKIKNDYSWISAPVVPMSSLDMIKPGEIYIKRIYMPVIEGEFIRSYVCAENGFFKDFDDEFAVRDFAPVNGVLPNDEAHTYKGVTDFKRTKDTEIQAEFEEEKLLEEAPKEETPIKEEKKFEDDFPFSFPEFKWKPDEDDDK